MVERLKRWESPCKRGRNDKGKGGSARARQLRKREQMLKLKLRKNSSIKAKGDREREITPSLFFDNLAYIAVAIVMLGHTTYWLESSNISSNWGRF